MNIRGRVRNGVVILEEGPPLPEGAVVTVLCPDVRPAGPAERAERVDLPLVPSEHPGRVVLTAERVAELLEETDVSA